MQGIKRNSNSHVTLFVNSILIILVIYNIEYKTSPWINDKDLIASMKNIEPFFVHLDSLPVEQVDKQAAINSYRNLIVETLTTGINSEKDMIFFIEKEDACFRRFIGKIALIDFVSSQN